MARKLFALTVTVATSTIVITLTGCARFPDGVTSQGPVAWNYQTASNRPAPPKAQKNVTLSIDDLTSKEPDFDNGLPGGMLRLFPLVSLAAPPLESTNRIADDYMNEADLGEYEVESILAGELSQSGFVADLKEPGGQQSYTVSGNVDFYWRQYLHFSGFGSFIYCLTAPAQLLPMGSGRLVCETNLRVTSADGTTPVLEKEYSSEVKYLFGVCYGNLHRHFKGYGEEVFPEIVRAFIADLEALPPSAWQKSSTTADMGN